MFEFNDKVTTTKKSGGTNPVYGIVIHHTAGGSYAGNLRYLSATKLPTKTDPKPRQNTVSCHFVIGPNGEAGKIGDPRDVLWHAGNGSWGKTPNVNANMLGIEVVGYGQPNPKQYNTLTRLVKHLIKHFPSISKENIVRHSDVTQSPAFTSKKILRNGKRKVKKADIGLPFFPEGFEQWREDLYK